jgi:acetyl-CoA carboxylase biotin carboxylase subunit
MGKVLVAARGETAVRVIRTCKKVGLSSVAVYAQNDEKSLHVRLADERVLIGPRELHKSYLNIDTMIAVANAYGVDLVHPGVGFLAESAAFAAACEKAGLGFVGPGADAMRIVGDKQQARRLLEANGVPIIPGTDGTVDTLSDAQRAAAAIGFPLLIKAAHGGGGRGIRIVTQAEALAGEYDLARMEAQQAFGDASVYLEKYIPAARHVEVQILADAHGNVLHLGTRDCSVQRKNQKLIEEAPAPFIGDGLRERIHEAAVNIARIVGYRNAGTVEFLLDGDDFYFLEMNARLQVEHPVTEEVYGLDLVKAQLQVAMGHRLSADQADIVARGHAIECRINAEDVARGFRPSPGVITALRQPGGLGVRVDSGYGPGDEVSPHYDSLILKLICRGDTRGEAAALSRAALCELGIEGVSHNADLARAILGDEDFLAGKLHTKWLEREFFPRVFGGRDETI